MFLVWPLILEPFAQGNFDAEYLSGVKQGFGGSGIIGGWGTITSLILILLAVILLALFLRKWIKPRQYRLGRGNPDQIVDPRKIYNIIERSVDLRAVYDLEVQDPNYKEIYHGLVLGINQNREIEVELTRFTDPNLDFKEKNVKVAFRMSRRGEQEFYQFDTISKTISYTTLYNRREKALHLLMPHTLSIGQKRRYHRVDIKGHHVFPINILVSSQLREPIPLKNFQRLYRVRAMDLSIGGIQAVLMARTSGLLVQPGDDVFLYFSLPLKNLDLIDIPKFFLVKAKIVSLHRMETGRRVMSKEASINTVGPHLIRFNFTEKGQVQQKLKAVTFRPITSYIFEDLSRWIQAYQRYHIQQERGTARQPTRTRNQYPSQKLEVEPKYPPQPLQKTGE